MNLTEFLYELEDSLTLGNHSSEYTTGVEEVIEAIQDYIRKNQEVIEDERNGNLITYVKVAD
jgi:hypothetical protein